MANSQEKPCFNSADVSTWIDNVNITAMWMFQYLWAKMYNWYMTYNGLNTIFKHVWVKNLVRYMCNNCAIFDHRNKLTVSFYTADCWLKTNIQCIHPCFIVATIICWFSVVWFHVCSLYWHVLACFGMSVYCLGKGWISTSHGSCWPLHGVVPCFV